MGESATAAFSRNCDECSEFVRDFHRSFIVGVDQRNDARVAKRTPVLEHGAGGFGGEATSAVIGMEEVDDL